MKKLLLLLLVPTFIQAEEFNLVCEGETFTFDDYGNKSNYSETIGIKVREENIKIKKYTYSTWRNDLIESSYIKDEDSISVAQTSRMGSCSYINYMVDINRVTGLIETIWRQTDSCKEGELIMQANFEGKCKKQKGNAF